jgi:hypothetical protein
MKPFFQFFIPDVASRAKKNQKTSSGGSGGGSLLILPDINY